MPGPKDSCRIPVSSGPYIAMSLYKRNINEFVEAFRELERKSEGIECDCQYAGATFTHAAMRGLMKRFGMMPQSEEIPESTREANIMCGGHRDEDNKT